MRLRKIEAATAPDTECGQRGEEVTIALLTGEGVRNDAEKEITETRRVRRQRMRRPQSQSLKSAVVAPFLHTVRNTEHA